MPSPRWRATPPVVRARYLFALKGLLETHFDELAAIVTRENGKTLDESRGSVRRAIENVEHACGIPTLLMGDALEDVATGIDCEYVRQPMGVFAAITPFNFPAMVPLWFWPYAIASGNTFVLKPSEQVPLSHSGWWSWPTRRGSRPGVLNLVHGGKDAVNALLRAPGHRRASRSWARRPSPGMSTRPRRSTANACRRWAAPRTT